MRLITFLITFFLLSFVFLSCSDNNNDNNKESSEESAENNNESASAPEVHGNEVKAGDVTITNPLNAEWISNGKKIYDVKCQACHKLSDERVVGPGWKGVTKKREPHWIMNMITNVEMMLEKDPEAQKLLEQCLVRMPNQNITKDEARHVLEFMRSNDGEK